MPNLERRAVLRGIALAVLAATGGTPRALADPTRLTLRVPAPSGVLTRLPGDGNRLALTVDDGTSTEVVAAFAEFCRDTGTRITFFPNGVYPSWTVNAPALRPMVDTGQIQLGNHTWSHPDITRLGTSGVADQIRRNADFLAKTYGVDGRPFFRPPYGRHTDLTDRVASDLGYHTITMWSDHVGDSRPIVAGDVISGATRAFRPQQIVLAHANQPAITHCYRQLADLIVARNLKTVTLKDIFT